METLTTKSIEELTDEELSAVCGGTFLEGEICIGGKRIDIYRAGVTYVNCAFGADEFYIGNKRISKALANEITLYGLEVWRNKYAASGDLIGFTKEWKEVLRNNYGIEWDGRMGEYRPRVF